MFGKFKKEKKTQAQLDKERLEAWSKTVPSILGLRVNGAIELDTVKLRTYAEELGWESVASTQMIEAVGVVPMGDTTVLRYYTNEEGFIQVVVNGTQFKDELVSDVKLFFYHDTIGIASDADWDQVLEPNTESGISQSTYELDGQSFTPVWVDAGSSNPPVAMTEKTHSDGEVSETDQFAMLYERDMGGEEYQFLLVAGEETIIEDRVDRCKVVSKGVNLSPSDFKYVG